jgi:hypothetical protein
LAAALKNPRKTTHDMMDATTMGLERVGRSLEMVADLASRAGRALDEVGASLLKAAHDVQTKANGRHTTGRTSTNGARTSSSRGRSSSGRSTSTRSAIRGPSSGGRASRRSSETVELGSEGSPPFAGVGA